MKRLSVLLVLWLSIYPAVIPAATERPALPNNLSSIFQVTSAADSGPGTLRQRLSNAQVGDTITFNDAVFPIGQPTTISVMSPLPSLSKDSIILDASDAGVILDGSQALAGTHGLVIAADNCIARGLTIQNFSGGGILVEAGASGNTIGGDRTKGAGPNGQGNLIIANGAYGVEIRGNGTDDNQLLGNYIGIDQSGQWAMGNAANGVAIWQGASRNTVGGVTSNYRNVISGNIHNGIWIGGTGTNSNVVSGNYIGTRADGQGAVGNGFSGVSIQTGAQENVIGGEAPGAGNLISGNQDNGVYISDPDTSANQILGNLIGTDWQGTAIIGQGLNGIVITLSARNNIIGTKNGRNVISGNAFDGVRFEGSDTINNTVQGNYIGTNLSGTAALPNGAHGVELAQGTHNNLVGGDRLSGEGNLISGNKNHGIVITDAANNNTVSGNIVGPDASGTRSLGNHPFGGIDITGGAYLNVIGGDTAGEGNLISGNQTDGLAIFEASDNQVQNNIIGLTLDGSRALSNLGPGIFNVTNAVRTRIEDNTISGNKTYGIQLSGDNCTDATLTGNFIGTDPGGSLPIPNGKYGVWISEGAQGHFLEDNLISGNKLGGVAIRNGGGAAPSNNTLQGNRIGTDASGILPLSNEGPGVLVSETAQSNVIGTGNTIAFNGTYGVDLQACNSNTITSNSIYSNTLSGIRSNCLSAPQVTAQSTSTLTGTTTPNARVEFFADDEDEGRIYVGFTTADAGGAFTFTPPSGFPIPNVTATSTDPAGKSSAFSPPVHLLWTVMLYMNGDNDLSEAMFDTLDNLAAAGPSQYANVLALVDGYTGPLTALTTHPGTVLYDISHGQTTQINTTLGISRTVPGELNMGDGQTLVDFVEWIQVRYPTSYTMLSIIDHGGGWAPSIEESVTGTLSRHNTGFLAGNSGLSWDFSSDYDYMDIQEVYQALETITNNGSEPLDILFFDVCLMGMAEVAYQVKDQAGFFVSSQNIGWAPVGAEGRYIQAVQALTSTTTPRQMAEILVQTYADSLPPEKHPFTVSAIDLAKMTAVAGAVNQLGQAISATLTTPEQVTPLQQAYLKSQKIDYDSDFSIETDTDGFVDLYDFAAQATQQYQDPAIIAGANAVTTALDSAILAEQHKSGSPWFSTDRVWGLDDTHGLSIFLPLGEDLELPILITDTSPITPSLVITRNLRLRELYTRDQLAFVDDTAWETLINTYYQVVSPSVPTDTTSGPVDGLLMPDATPPQTVITLTGQTLMNQAITVTWSATDTQSGVASATLWYRPPGQSWLPTGLTQTGTAGVFQFTLPGSCTYALAAQAMDNAGNKETIGSAPNTVVVDIDYCLSLPVVFRGDTTSRKNGRQ